MKALSLVILLIFLGVIAGGTILESSAVMKNFDRSRSDFREREKMKELLDMIVRDFDYLINTDADYEHHPVLESIRSEYTAYSLTIKDISSGCNLNFLPDSDLSDSVMASFLFAEGNADEFIRFRRYNGFVTDIFEWQRFLKEEALSAVVCYGWFSSLHNDAEIERMLSASYGRSGEELYPLMNDMPLINVNTMDTSIIAPLLSRRSWNINGAATKAAALKSRLEHGPITQRELQTLLELAENHDVFRYLGVRTAFWSIFFHNGRYVMNAIIAAIPERGGKEILRYSIIEGRLSRV